MKRRAAARNAITAAEVDRKLRRALLRKYQRQQGPLTLGQSCFYWRDSRASDLKKIRWHGPARVVVVEHDEQGRPRLYWVAHRTQLIRAAPHHVRPDFTDLQVAIDGLQAARHDIAGLKSRGVTRFLDLGRLNRRNIDDVDDDEEGMQDDAPDDGEDGDGGDPQEPPSTRRRTGDHPGVDLDLPPADQPDLDFLPVPEPIADPRDLDLDLQSAGERSVSLPQTTLVVLRLALNFKMQVILQSMWALMRLNLDLSHLILKHQRCTQEHHQWQLNLLHLSLFQRNHLNLLQCHLHQHLPT